MVLVRHQRKSRSASFLGPRFLSWLRQLGGKGGGGGALQENNRKQRVGQDYCPSPDVEMLIMSEMMKPFVILLRGSEEESQHESDLTFISHTSFFFFAPSVSDANCVSGDACSSLTRIKKKYIRLVMPGVAVKATQSPCSCLPLEATIRACPNGKHSRDRCRGGRGQNN